MSKRQHAAGGEEFVHKDNNGSRSLRYAKPSRNLTWRRDPLARDHTTTFPTATDPAASSVVTNPAARHPYRFGAHESLQYDPGPVYPQNVYGAYGAPSYRNGTHASPSRGSKAHYPHGSRDRYPPSYGSRDHYPSSYGSRDHYPPSHGSRDHYPPSHGSRDYYPPSHGSRDHYPPSHGSRDYYPPQGAGASGRPSYGVRAPSHLSHSLGVAARNLTSHGLGVHGFPSYETGAVVPSPKFPAVSLRGLPRNCQEVDIIRFFDGLDIVDVFLVFINRTFSRKGFVVFSNAAAADSALQRDKQKLGDASVEIFTCRRQDYYDAVAAAVNDCVDFGNTRESNHNNVVLDANYHESHQGQAAIFKNDSVVNNTHKQKSDTVSDSILHGHPNTQPENLLDKDQVKPTRHILKVCGHCFVDKKEILDVFGECNLSEDRVHNVFHPDGKPAGEILLELISQDDAKKAMSKDKTMIDSDLIEIVPCLGDLRITNTGRRLESGSHDRVNNSDDKEIIGPDAHSHGKPRSYNEKLQKVYTQILKLGNVPPSADMYDIIEFFGECNKLALDRLQVVCDRDGICTGEVYVEFDSIEDAKEAISKDKRMILSQYVELFPSSPHEASRAMSRSW